MTIRKRTFIAIKIDPKLKLLNLIDEVKEELADEAINWVDEGNLHLTLRFLGGTTDIQISPYIGTNKKFA